MGMRIMKTEAPGLREAWVILTRTSLGARIWGVGWEVVRSRTVVGGPVLVCVQARIVGGGVVAMMNGNLEDADVGQSWLVMLS